MKKRIPTFLSGALAATLVFSLGLTAMAAAGQVTFGQFGLSLLGKEVLAEGETITGENGAEVPAVLTYTDEKGGSTNYIAVRKIAELFDAPIDWDDGNNCVAVAPAGETTITFGAEPQSEVDRKTPLTPEYGVTAGPFTEVDPATIDLDQEPSVYMADTRYYAQWGVDHQQFFGDTRMGNYLVITFTNNGDRDLIVDLSRCYTASIAHRETFTKTRLEPGVTIQRAFYIEEGWPELTYNTLEANIRSAMEEGGTGGLLPVDVTISAVHYQ